jgi:hypothetical protein
MRLKRKMAAKSGIATTHLNFPFRFAFRDGPRLAFAGARF